MGYICIKRPRQRQETDYIANLAARAINKLNEVTAELDEIKDEDAETVKRRVNESPRPAHRGRLNRRSGVYLVVPILSYNLVFHTRIRMLQEA